MSLYQASFRIQVKDNIECDKPVSSWPDSGVECPSTSKTKPISPWSIQYCSPQRHHIKCDHTERLTEEWLLIWKERIASTDINGKLIEVRDRMVACHMKRQSSISWSEGHLEHDVNSNKWGVVMSSHLYPSTISPWRISSGNVKSSPSPNYIPMNLYIVKNTTQKSRLYTFVVSKSTHYKLL